MVGQAGFDELHLFAEVVRGLGGRGRGEPLGTAFRRDVLQREQLVGLQFPVQGSPRLDRDLVARRKPRQLRRRAELQIDVDGPVGSIDQVEVPGGSRRRTTRPPGSPEPARRVMPISGRRGTRRRTRR